MSDRFAVGEFLDDYVVTAVRGLKGKQGRMLPILSLTPLAACGGGGGGDAAVAVPVVVPPDPDYSEGPTGTFTGKDDTDLTLSQSSATTNLIVLSKGGNDTISTGSGNDMIRGGLGADTIDAGAGNDVFLIVGSTGAGEYADADITNAGGTGLDLSSLLSLATLNDQPVSEGAAGEIINGGSGTNTLVIYGDVDLTGLTLSNVTTLVVNSVVTLTPQQLAQFTTVNGDGQSVINIVDDPDDDTVYVIDLSVLELSNVATITTSGDVRINLSSLDDLDGIGSITGDGNLQVTIVDAGSGTVTADQVSAMISGTVSIVAETPTVSIDDITANEAAGTATFSVTLSAASGQNVTVGYTAPDGTSGTLTFSPGETSKSFSTAWVDDGLDEANEMQSATLSSPTNATIADSSGSLTIMDDDAAPTISIHDIAASEADGTDTFTVLLSAASGKTVTVDYAAPDGTAGTLTYAPGETSKTFTTAWADDDLDETNEIQSATLSNPGNATIADGAGTLTITDDDAPPTIRIADISYQESIGTAWFPVMLSAKSGKTITVDYAAPDGTTGTLIFAPGETSKFFASSWLDDIVDEADETQTATLGNPINATITDGSGLLTIMDDDAPVINIDDITAIEADGSATFTVTLSPLSSKTVTVDYTAPFGATGTLTFAPGETVKSFDVTWTDDSYDEADVTWSAFLTNPGNATIADNSGGLTLIDDDETPVIVSAATVSIEEGTTTAFTIGATDSDGDVLTYTRTGGTSDWSLFDVNAITGAVTFVAAPDFESPADSGGDNVYDLIVKVSDGVNSASQNVTITVTNGNDLPAGSVTVSGTSFKDQTLTAANTLSDQDGMGPISYQWQRDGADVSGATASSYTLAWADMATEISVIAIYTDGQGTIERVSSAAVSASLANSIELSSLNGSNGFVLRGIDAGDMSGISVSNAGDLNGDGYDDLIIGAPNAAGLDGFGGNFLAGESYVVYGGVNVDGGDGVMDLWSLNGATGFLISGIDAGDNSGRSVSSAGDVNGDGYDDLIIGAAPIDQNGSVAASFAGEAYIVYGGININGGDRALDLSTLNGATGFVLNGIDYRDSSGARVSSAGDFNGDGYDDLIITAKHADPNGNGEAGESYIVYGGTSVDGGDGVMDLSALDGTNGFVVNGIDISDESGSSVSSAGDINGDGYDDLIIGAPSSFPYDLSTTGESYVVYGGNGVDGGDGVLDLSALNGGNGFVLSGVDLEDQSGFSVSGIGDFNGDGYDDLIIGTPGGDANGNKNAGESYIVYGGLGIDGGDGVLDLSNLDGTNGFVLNGINAFDQIGWSVSGAGDLNGDGYDDLIIGGALIDTGAGKTYVVYGGASVDGGDGAMDLSALNGTSGFVLNGIDSFDYSGASVSSAGDINGDGYDDLIIGAPLALGNGGSDSGESYVVYGSATSLDVHMGTVGNDVMTGGVNDERIIGREGDDTITSGSGYDVLVFDGDFGNDIVTDYTQGMDLFDFSDSEFIEDITDLTISLVGGDTVLDDGQGNTITLTGFTGTLTNGDFDFA